jgi:hypothetical protein
VSTYNLNGYTPGDAASLGDTLNSSGGQFYLTPNSGGYNLQTDDATTQAMMQSAGYSQSGVNAPAPAADAAMTGSGNYTDGSQGGSAETSSVLGGPTKSGPTKDGVFDQFLAWLKSSGGNILAVVLGLLFLGLGVYGMVNK